MTAKRLLNFVFSSHTETPREPDRGETEINEGEIRAALARIVRDSIRPIVTGFSVVLFVASITILLFPFKESPGLVSILSALMGILFLTFGLALGRRSIPPAWAHPLSALVAGAGWLICMLVMYFDLEPYQTTSFMLLIVAAGFLLLSTRWLWAIVSLTVLGWASLVWMGKPSRLWIHFGFALFVATVLALVVHTLRIKALRRVEVLRIRNEVRRAELEAALYALQQSETRLRKMTEQLPAVLWTTDAELRFTSAVGMGLTTLGLQPSAAIGKLLAQYFPAKDPLYPPIEAHRQALLGTSKNFEIGWGGRLFDCHVEPLRDPGGRIIGVLGLGNDVTERKISETEVRILNEQLEQRVIERTAELRISEERNQTLYHELNHVARVTTMGELAASIAHEVNQPLCAIVNNANFCRRRLESSSLDLAEVRDAMNDIVESGSRASEIIARIRALLRKVEVEPVCLKIDEIIRQVVDLMHNETIKRGVLLEIETQADLRPVLGDRVQLQQVTLNLIINSFDAMNEVPPAERKLLIRSSQSEHNKVLVEVRDSGSGIDPHNLERIFDAFYTTKADGMGMGLSINQTIIRAHGGRLWAVNNNGRGATFQFTLPTFSEAK